LVKYRNSLRGLHTIGDYNDDPARLRGLVVPTLVVNGANTVAFHRAINASLMRLLPRAEAMELTGGHNSPASALGVLRVGVAEVPATNRHRQVRAAMNLGVDAFRRVPDEPVAEIVPDTQPIA
jgi:hypothetical protein